MFEIRVAVGVDPATHHTQQASHTLHGTRADAEAALTRLVARAHLDGSLPGPLLRLDELLTRWIEADHPWKPSTLVGYRSVARFLTADPITRCRAEQLMPGDVRAAMQRWRQTGASDAVLAGRFRTLRAALSWAYAERIIDQHPLRAMRGPTRATPRRPLPDNAVRILLRTAETLLLEAIANDTGHRHGVLRRHRCELDLLLVRLAADSGARRGELAALRLDDLQGRVLHIARADSAGQLTAPKSGHGRTLTLGAGTAGLWHTLVAEWEHRAGHTIGPWLFAADLDHRRRLNVATLGHRFVGLRDTAEIPDATLHRLRHSVATFLVARGEILQAQSRLGHADAATTLREYAYALPLTDGDVADADALDRHLEHHPAPAQDPQRTPSWE